MPKIDTDDRQVFALETTVSAMRSYLDGVEVSQAITDFDDIVDEAQGHVHSGEDTHAYIVIRINKDAADE